MLTRVHLDHTEEDSEEKEDLHRVPLARPAVLCRKANLMQRAVEWTAEGTQMGHL